MFKLLTSIGIIVMFLVGTIIGIQFMIASAEDKAKVKEALIPYIIGCAVIFGAFTIWSIAVDLGQDISGTSSGTSSEDSSSGIVEARYCSNCGTDLSHYEIERGRCDICGTGI